VPLGIISKFAAYPIEIKFVGTLTRGVVTSIPPIDALATGIEKFDCLAKYCLDRLISLSKKLDS